MTIWITGAGGLLGNYLVQTAPNYVPSAKVRGLTRADLDLTDFTALRACFERERPDVIIHCAALTRIPVCQSDPTLAHRLNVVVTEQLAALAEKSSLVFLSTDLVFDGRTPPYDETAAVNPLSVYAQTKVAAERIVLANPRHAVVRTSLNGGKSPTGDRGFNEQMRQAWEQGQCLRLFVDEFRCPIPAEVTARGIWELVVREQTGLFHLAGSERLSRWQIGQLLAARWPHLKPQLAPTSLENYVGAPRSPDPTLKCGKVQRLLSFALPGLTDWLAAHPADKF